jgi:hypothetical protein
MITVVLANFSRWFTLFHAEVCAYLDVVFPGIWIGHAGPFDGPSIAQI